MKLQKIALKTSLNDMKYHKTALSTIKKDGFSFQKKLIRHKKQYQM